jgi:CBS domain-containing protein
VAEGKGPETPVRELMSVEPVAADPDDEIETVREVMIRERVRRVPVVGRENRLVGIIAQADLAREDAAASDREVGRIVEAISEPEPNN